MSIYDTYILEQQIDAIAQENDGEFPAELFEKLVESETQTEAQVENLVKYLQDLKYQTENLKTEIDRLARKKQVTQNKIDNIEKYMLPYVELKGKHNVGNFTLNTRKSKKVNLVDDFYNIDYGVEKTIFNPDKKAIKTAIENGAEIKGAEIIENKKITIK